MKVLFLCPEPPYPLHGGGAYRTASLLHYFARIAAVELILFSDSGQPALLPGGLVQSQHVIELPVNSKTLAARYLRNARRAIRRVPPLIDRLSGFEDRVARIVAGQHYDLGIVEHFWCAPYVGQLAPVCGQTILDLHNIESILHQRCAEFASGAVKAGHRRFAAASRKLEAALLPDFSLVLATSEADANAARALAPPAVIEVYPNSFPWVEIPGQTEQQLVVFSANFEYHPNIDAVRFLINDIWPELRRRHPELRLKLVGRGDSFIRHLLPADPAAHNIETTGPIPDALAEIARARVVIAPIRSGSGTRIKIMEAWAAARPVVATSLAAEGIETHDGENIALGNTAEELIDTTDRLLRDETLRASIGMNGRRTYESRYSWNAAWAVLDRIPQLTRYFGLNRYTGKA